MLVAGALVLGQAPAGEGGREPSAARPVPDWAREGVLPVYMVHQTAAVVLAAWVLSWPVAPGVQWLVLTVLTIACSLALYDLLRRFGVARVLMGMRPRQPAHTAPASQAG